MQVALRVAAVDAPGPSIAPDWLGAAERARFDRMSSVRRRAQFVAGRRLARELLAGLHGGDPLRDWPLAAPADGPPAILRSGVRAAVALSHSRDVVACAVASSAIGIDVEVDAGTRALASLVAGVCSPAEQQRYAELHGDAARRYFHALWTLKEARLKQDGGGVTPARLAALSVHPDPEGPGWACARGHTTLAVCAAEPWSFDAETLTHLASSGFEVAQATRWNYAAVDAPRRGAAPGR